MRYEDIKVGDIAFFLPGARDISGLFLPGVVCKVEDKRFGYVVGSIGSDIFYFYAEEVERVSTVDPTEIPLADEQLRAKAVGRRMQYTEDAKRRKEQPAFRGFLQYFPAAVHLVADLSRQGNEKHSPGEPIHHARGKSPDHADALTRHLMDVGKIDPETDLDYAVHVAWRALALLQEMAENQYGWPKAPGAK